MGLTPRMRPVTDVNEQRLAEFRRRHAEAIGAAESLYLLGSSVSVCIWDVAVPLLRDAGLTRDEVLYWATTEHCSCVACRTNVCELWDQLDTAAR